MNLSMITLVCMVVCVDTRTLQILNMANGSIRRCSLQRGPVQCNAGSSTVQQGTGETSGEIVSELLAALDAVQCDAHSWRTVQQGELDMALLEEWMRATLQKTSIQGMAGVLSIHCATQKFVLRGAHLHGSEAHLEGEYVDAAWREGEARESKLVLLGRRLDHETLEQGLRGCLVSAASVERRLKTLRFSVGDAVECRTPRGWTKARVVDQLYRDDSMPPGLVAPYQLRLEEAGAQDGALIYAPEDTREVVRATRLERLRFGVGDAVECNLGERWAKGKVVDLMYREPGVSPAVVAPYQVELVEGAMAGTLIYAPTDSAEVIRKPWRFFDVPL